MEQRLEICPVCKKHLVISKLTCQQCKISIDGNFQFSTLAKLDYREQEFIELFVKARGNIKKLEKIIGVSYPTICKQLDAINKKIGIGSKVQK